MSLRLGFQFKTRQDRGVRRKSEICGVFAFKLKADGFLNVGHQFIERRSLGDDRQIEALCDKLLFTLENPHMNDPFHAMHHIQVCRDRTTALLILCD